MSARKHSQRGQKGRFTPRSMVVDAVSGQPVEGRDDSQLHRLDDGDVVHPVARDWSNGPAISALMDRGEYNMKRVP